MTYLKICGVIIHIYIYIYIERERERETQQCINLGEMLALQLPPNSDTTLTHMCVDPHAWDPHTCEWELCGSWM
jgi:hypothetical protein